MLKIGIDLDSTLNNLDDAWSNWICKYHDPDFTLDKWTDWNISKLTKAGNKVLEFLFIPGAFLSLWARPGAVEFTKSLADRGHQLFAVTTSHAGCWPDKAAWLEKTVPAIPKENYIVTSHKGLLKLDALIDDGPHNFKGFDGQCILIDQPWNRSFQIGQNQHRCKNWDEVMRVINWIESGWSGMMKSA